MPVITEGPVSVTDAMIGTNVHFHCAGTGGMLLWTVDGFYHHYKPIVDRGITAVTVPSSNNTVQSTLTVPATSVNNGTTVQCSIHNSLLGSVAFSNNATLTVLPGEF